MKVVMEQFLETFPLIATWWTQQTAKLFTPETFVVYGMYIQTCNHVQILAK